MPQTLSQACDASCPNSNLRTFETNIPKLAIQTFARIAEICNFESPSKIGRRRKIITLADGSVTGSQLGLSPQKRCSRDRPAPLSGLALRQCRCWTYARHVSSARCGANARQTEAAWISQKSPGPTRLLLATLDASQSFPRPHPS